MKFFRACAPKICQFQCGEYFAEPRFHGLRFDSVIGESPRNSLNENKPKAEVAIATVATVSQSMFEAPSDEWGISSTSKKASRGYQPPIEELGRLDERTSTTGLASTPGTFSTGLDTFATELGTLAMGSSTVTTFVASHQFSLLKVIPFNCSEGSSRRCLIGKMRHFSSSRSSIWMQGRSNWSGTCRMVPRIDDLEAVYRRDWSYNPRGPRQPATLAFRLLSHRTCATLSRRRSGPQRTSQTGADMSTKQVYACPFFHSE